MVRTEARRGLPAWPYPLTMAERDERLLRLAQAGTRSDALDALWDLRDLAFDRPELFEVLTAETLFQALAEELESSVSTEWEPSAGPMLAGAAARAFGSG